MKRKDVLTIVRMFKQKLHSSGLPVHEIILYGSLARGEGYPWSDIDVAVVCDPFRRTRHEENM